MLAAGAVNPNTVNADGLTALHQVSPTAMARCCLQHTRPLIQDAALRAWPTVLF